MASERCAFDANVIVSALLFPHSKPGRAFFSTLRDGTVLISDQLMAELRGVLDRPKFDRYVSPANRARLLNRLIGEGDLAQLYVTIEACRDPKDNHILELSVSDAATCIISGAGDLLALDPFQGIAIVSPETFLARRQPGERE